MKNEIRPNEAKLDTTCLPKTVVIKNPNGDNRTCNPKKISFEQFREANLSHQREVKSVMSTLAMLLINNGLIHDYTKNSSLYQEYYEYFKDFKEKQGIDFINGSWYQHHITAERHHPNSYCCSDINLLDIIETIVDCVCAGKARSGEIRDLEFDSEIVQKAIQNTVKLIDDITVVEDLKK